jgi:acetyl-CoA acetyltransferase
VQSRRNAGLHANSHKRAPISIEDVLTAKPVSDPLGLLDCCLISDAAGAIVVASPDLAQKSKGKAAWLYGLGECHTHEHLVSAPSLTRFGAVDSGRRAFEMAGLGVDSIDVAQLYDCFSIVPIIEAEELGLCRDGQGGPGFAAGEFALGGRLPVNTHGGMMSHAHAGAAGGLFGVIEAVRQLRGECEQRQVASANVALVHNEGGILSSHCTMIFGGERR